MNHLIEVVETNNAKKNFFPTPDSVAEGLLSGINLRDYRYILEPSAGKGDLALYVVGHRYKQIHGRCIRNPKTDDFDIVDGNLPENEREWSEAIHGVDIECIEIDPVLRNVLENKGLRVVHDDFLTYETQKRYDLIVMNPPFDAGADHLLKAIDLMRRGGTIACILNAETIRNPYAYKRQQLIDILDKYNASIRFVSNAFSDAERSTDVEIALINLDIPQVKIDSTIMDEMRKAPTYKTSRVPSDVSEMVQYNVIEEWVNRYNFEAACGIRLIEEYRAMRTMTDEGLGKYDKPLLSLSIGGNADSSQGLSINEYLRQTRGKYWSRLFNQPVITDKFTSNLLEELRDNVRKLVDYEFSVYNILTLIIKMNQRTVKGIEETIIALFDKWTSASWYEESPNRHYYNGWKTNDCFRVGKKVITSFNAFSWYHESFEEYRVEEFLSDINKTLDFLDCNRTEWVTSLRFDLNEAKKKGQTKKIETKYFFATFYKKGTCHLEFKNMDLLEKFNMFASQRKGWLPPTYGKKRYNDMSEEEKAVVDSFQGKKKYEEVMTRADYFLNMGQQQLMLGASIA